MEVFSIESLEASTNPLRGSWLCVNRGDWDDRGDFLVFGNNAFEKYVAEMSGERPEESTTHDVAVNSLLDFFGNQKIRQGEHEISKRISLNGTQKGTENAEIADLISSWSDEDRKFIVEALQGDSSPESHVSTSDNKEDALDAASASEALRKLDDAVGRLSTFDEIGPIRTAFAGPRSAEYFEEAHGCDLDGHRIATAVLCRAVLEAALKETIDPKGRIKQAMKSGESYIGLMISEAARLHLDHERASAAIEIRDAGNDAIHDLRRFQKNYQLRMRGIVDNLRKVLIDLYEN